MKTDWRYTRYDDSLIRDYIDFVKNSLHILLYKEDVSRFLQFTGFDSFNYFLKVKKQRDLSLNKHGQLWQVVRDQWKHV